MSVALKPCPFCGGEVGYFSSHEEGVRYVWIVCVCGARATSFRQLSSEEAARIWNRRSKPTTP